MRNYEAHSDLDLLALLKQDNMSAFEELYERYWSKLYAAAYKRTRNKESSEEIVQDLFTSIWTNRNTLAVHSSFQNYLYSSVRYMVFAGFQKETYRKNYESFLIYHQFDMDNSTEDTIALNELKRSINERVQSLPEKCKAVFELSRKEHRSNKEIAFYMGISEKTVENHLTKALKTLRISLKHAGTLLFLLIFLIN